jgi:hypothetical protein
MYCDRSAYYQKAIKATARRLKISSNLLEGTEKVSLIKAI